MENPLMLDTPGKHTLEQSQPDQPLVQEQAATTQNQPDSRSITSQSETSTLPREDTASLLKQNSTRTLPKQNSVASSVDPAVEEGIERQIVEYQNEAFVMDLEDTVTK